MSRHLLRLAFFASLGFSLGLVFRWVYLDALRADLATFTAYLGG